MRIMFTLAALSLGLAAASPAFADGGADCGNPPKDQWMTQEAAKEKATALGYEVRRVKIDNGCYEVYAFDKNKAKVEVYLHPVTGEVVKPKNGN